MSYAQIEPAKSQRLQVELSIPQMEALQKLMAVCGIDTRKELINNALTLLEWAADEVQKGNDVVSLNKERKQYEVLKMPALMHASRFAQSNQQDRVNSSPIPKGYSAKRGLAVVE